MFRCYGTSSVNAEAIWVALDNAINRTHNTTVGSATIKNITGVVNGADSVDPDKNWPLVMASYMVSFFE